MTKEEILNQIQTLQAELKKVEEKEKRDAINQQIMLRDANVQEFNRSMLLIYTAIDSLIEFADKNDLEFQVISMIVDRYGYIPEEWEQSDDEWASSSC